MKFEKFKDLEKVKSWKADVAGAVGHIESWKILVKKNSKLAWLVLPPGNKEPTN